MDSETNKNIVRRYVEMWNTGNVALADEILAPTYVDLAHPDLIGPESIKQAVLATRAASPDFQITLDFIMSEGDTVAMRDTIRMTRQGKGIVTHGMVFIRIAEGKMVKLVQCYERVE